MKLNLDLPGGIRPDIVKGYCLFHQLENWFRELVYLELKAHYGLEWWQQTSAALKRSTTPGIPAEKSLKADKLHPHMSTAENDPLWYLSFDSILKIVFDQKLWPLFLPYLTTKKLLRAKFDEIKPIRNRIAHCRSLHKDDISRVETVLRDIDQGFWKLCTSYNKEHGFIAHLREDPVYKHFTKENMCPTLNLRPENGQEWVCG